MKVFILDKEFELENKIESVEKIFDRIKDVLEETEYNFSYFIADGEEIHNEFEIYLEDNIKSISELRVVMLSTKDIVLENLVTIDEYLDRAIPIINDLADSFNRGADADDWNHISELFEGIGFILYTLESIDTMQNTDEIVSNYSVWNEYVSEVKSLEEMLKKLNTAVEDKNETLISELLTLQIIPAFKGMKEKLDVLVAID